MRRWVGIALCLMAGLGCQSAPDADDVPAETTPSETEDERTPVASEGAVSLIPRGVAAHYVAGDRSDLSLSMSGDIVLVEAHYLPIDTLSVGAWLTIGAGEQSSPVLSGRFRFQRYRDLLLDLLLQSDAPIGVEAKARVDESLAVLADARTIGDVANAWETLAESWAGPYPEAFRPTLQSLRRMATVPIGASRENDSLRAIAAEAVHYADVIARMNVLRVMSRTSHLRTDPAYVNALGEAERRLKKRRSITVSSLMELARIRIVDPPLADVPSLLDRVRLPIVPRRAVTTVFPNAPDSLVARLGFDKRVKEEREVDSVRIVQWVDATLTLYATIEHGLYGEVPPEDECVDPATDFADDIRVARQLRRYAAIEYARVVTNLLDTTPELTRQAWSDHADITADDIDTAKIAADALATRQRRLMSTCDTPHPPITPPN